MPPDPGSPTKVDAYSILCTLFSVLLSAWWVYFYFMILERDGIAAWHISGYPLANFRTFFMYGAPIFLLHVFYQFSVSVWRIRFFPATAGLREIGDVLKMFYLSCGLFLFAVLVSTIYAQMKFELFVQGVILIGAWILCTRRIIELREPEK